MLLTTQIGHISVPTLPPTSRPKDTSNNPLYQYQHTIKARHFWKMPSPRNIVNLIFCEWKLLGRASITCCTPCFQQSSALTLASALALALDLACKHHRFSFTVKLRIEETSSSNKTFKTDWKRLLQEYWNLQTCKYSIRLTVYLNHCRVLTAWWLKVRRKTVNACLPFGRHGNTNAERRY